MNSNSYIWSCQRFFFYWTLPTYNQRTKHSLHSTICSYKYIRIFICVKNFIWIYSNIRLYSFLDTNIFRYSCIAKSTQMSHSGANDSWSLDKLLLLHQGHSWLSHKLHLKVQETRDGWLQIQREGLDIKNEIYQGWTSHGKPQFERFQNLTFLRWMLSHFLETFWWIPWSSPTKSWWNRWTRI